MHKTCIWAALLFAVATTTANAHSHLRSSTPAEGSTVAGPPAQVVLGFSEVSHLAALTVARGSQAAIKVEPLPQQPAQRLIVPLPKLGAGAWTLGWRVIGEDGHVTHGIVHFYVTAP